MKAVGEASRTTKRSSKHKILNFSSEIRVCYTQKNVVISSVADSDPDPSGPYVFGPPGSGSGSASQRYGYGSGSGSFYHQAKIVRKTLLPTVLRLLFDFLSLNNDVNLSS
jgi:hypothetical protein